MLRVLLIEDDQRVATAVRQGFAKESAISVVEHCPSLAAGNAALERGLEFEVAVVDIGLPDGTGTELMQRIGELRPNAIVLAFTQFDDAPTVFKALRAGAVGYLLKTTPIDRLIRAITEATQGGAPMSPSVARLVVESFSVPVAADAESRVALSARESDVLKLLALGKRYDEAAAELGVELSTVQTHVKSIYRKLHVNSKAQAAEWARKQGLVR